MSEKHKIVYWSHCPLQKELNSPIQGHIFHIDLMLFIRSKDQIIITFRFAFPIELYICGI